MSRPARMADCHPDRPHFGRGMCRSCYIRDWRLRGGAMKPGGYRQTHGKSSTPEYGAWSNAKNRCTNPRDANWKNYGGRGIRMAPEWLNDPLAFIDYIGPRPSSAHSLDRIDNDGHYEPGNVRWATPREQLFNRGRRPALSDVIKLVRLWWRHRSRQAA